MELNEFLRSDAADEVNDTSELDVQKAVVESLAADKAEQDERIAKLQRDNYALRSENATLKSKLEEMRASLARVGDLLAANAEGETANKISLLDRNPELADRFVGETRDHVLEVVRIARDADEKEGRLRRAQLLEGVLVANEPNGTLAKKREMLTKFFQENGNILNGVVIAELEKYEIAYKNGDQYLLPAEIIKRIY